MNTYQLNAMGRCPDNGDLDVYEIEIAHQQIINVSDIRRTVYRLLETPVYQEDFTAQLAEMLKASVTVKGWHQGILVTSTVG